MPTSRGADRTEHCGRLIDRLSGKSSGTNLIIVWPSPLLPEVSQLSHLDSLAVGLVVSDLLHKMHVIFC